LNVRFVERVRQRHDIPEHVIKCRFELAWKNFENYYKNAVDDWTVYDIYNDEPILIEWKQKS
jgi:predicted ABC-type ATPase